MSVAQVATCFYVVAVEVDQKSAIERSASCAGSTIITCALQEACLMKAIDCIAHGAEKQR